MNTNFNPFNTYPFAQTPFYGSFGIPSFTPGNYGPSNWNNWQTPFVGSNTTTPWNTTNFNPFQVPFGGYNQTPLGGFNGQYTNGFNSGLNTVTNGWNPFWNNWASNTIGTSPVSTFNPYNTLNSWNTFNPYTATGWNQINPFAGFNGVQTPFANITPWANTAPWTNTTPFGGTPNFNGFAQPFGTAYPFGVAQPFGIGTPNVWNGQFPFNYQPLSPVNVPFNGQTPVTTNTNGQQVEHTGRIAAYPMPFGGFAPFMCANPQQGVSNCTPVTQAA